MNLADFKPIKAGTLLSIAGLNAVQASAAGAFEICSLAVVALTWQHGHFSGESGVAGDCSSFGASCRWQWGHAAGGAASASAAARGLGQHHPKGSASARAFEKARNLHSIPITRL